MTITPVYSLYDKTSSRSGSDNYREIEDKLGAHQEFAGNSMSAFWNGDQYVVLSYSTVIAIVTIRALRSEHGEVEIADNRWGPTSGRHINMCKRVL